MNKDLVAFFEYMEREKGIKRDVIVAAIRESLLAAARKRFRTEANISVEINARSGDIEVFCEKEIVETVDFPNTQIALEYAQEIDPDCEVGQFIDIEVTPENFGRIATQAARQIINQKLLYAERDVIYEEYRHRVNELVSGSVKRFVRGANMVIDLGKVEAFMPARHYPKTERYNVGDRILALLYAVQDLDNGGAEVILSRSDPEFVKQLFTQEVPEINDGTVVIAKIVREPGYRTKVIVRSTDMRVDPVGTCVGVRGTRVKAVVRELGNEKVDIIPYSEDPIQLLQNALDPIQIRKISMNEEEKIVSIVVDDDTYAIVIGKRGMNARLNGALIGYELEAQKMTDYQQLMAVTRAEISESDLPGLDDPLKVEEINPLVIENLIEAGYNTARKVLQVSEEDLATAGSGISLEMANSILESVQGRFSHLLGSKEEAVPEKEEPIEEQEANGKT